MAIRVSSPAETAQSSPGLVTIPVQDGAEGLVEMLNSNGVEYLFLNSGTDTFPILEAMSRMIEQGRKTPKAILCIDEATGIFAAHGFYQLTGRPQVVLVHVDAGTAQLGGAYHNVQRDHSAVVVCAGRAPMTIGGALPGAKDRSIHWIQEQPDQNGIVRTFTKWDYELRRNESLNWVVQKAFQVATTEPSGLVYLTLPRENLLEKIDRLEVPPVSRHSPPIAPAADAEALRTLADWLVDARYPLIIAGTPGRHPETVPHLAALAEAVGARVLGGLTTRLNLPTDHPMNVGGVDAAMIKEADVILVIDHDVPWVPDEDTLEPKAKIAWIDIDPTKDTIPLWTFPADLLIHAASQQALPALVEAVKERITAADSKSIDERAAQIAEESEARRQRAAAAAEATAREKPISPAWVAHCLSQALPEDAIVMNETVTNAEAVTSLLKRTQPNTFFGSGGASLGWALGAAFGAKLANPTRDVVAMQGDGAFVFGRPTSVFWATEKYDAPVLTIIFNNSQHRATVNNWNNNIPDSAAKRTGNYVGVDIDPSPDYHLLVQACRGYGEKVEDPREVMPAIRRGLERVRAGQSVVLDIRISR